MSEIERKNIWQVERRIMKQGVLVSRTIGFYNSAARAIDAIRRRVEGEITAAIGRTTIGGANTELDLGTCEINLTPTFLIVCQSVEVDNYPHETQPEGEYAHVDPEEFPGPGSIEEEYPMTYHIAEDLGDVS